MKLLVEARSRSTSFLRSWEARSWCLGDIFSAIRPRRSGSGHCRCHATIGPRTKQALATRSGAMWLPCGKYPCGRRTIGADSSQRRQSSETLRGNLDVDAARMLARVQYACAVREGRVMIAVTVPFAIPRRAVPAWVDLKEVCIARVQGGPR